MNLSFWKILGFFGVVSGWAQESLQPDADGKVRITVDELSELAEAMCEAFGWQAEIVLPVGPEKEAISHQPLD